MGDTNSQLRVLVVTSDPFWQHHRGSSQRIRTMLDYLITFCDVTICFIGELTIREWTEATAILPCQIVGPGEPGKVAASIVGTAAKWLSNHEARKGDEPIQSEPVSLEVFAINSDSKTSRLTDSVGTSESRSLRVGVDRELRG